jgi:hypothetical protein
MPEGHREARERARRERVELRYTSRSFDMKKIAIAVALALGAVAPNAFAEDDPGMTYNYRGAASRAQAQDLYDQGYIIDNRGYREYRYRDDRYRDDRYRDDRFREDRWRREGYECWNPRARHFEGVREGERQDDLDFSRCRTAR